MGSGFPRSSMIISSVSHRFPRFHLKIRASLAQFTSWRIMTREKATRDGIPVEPNTPKGSRIPLASLSALSVSASLSRATCAAGAAAAVERLRLSARSTRHPSLALPHCSPHVYKSRLRESETQTCSLSGRVISPACSPIPFISSTIACVRTPGGRVLMSILLRRSVQWTAGRGAKWAGSSALLPP